MLSMQCFIFFTNSTVSVLSVWKWYKVLQDYFFLSSKKWCSTKHWTNLWKCVRSDQTFQWNSLIARCAVTRVVPTVVVSPGWYLVPGHHGHWARQGWASELRHASDASAVPHPQVSAADADWRFLQELQRVHRGLPQQGPCLCKTHAISIHCDGPLLFSFFVIGKDVTQCFLSELRRGTGLIPITV